MLASVHNSNYKGVDMWSFLESYTANNSWIRCSSKRADNGKTKGSELYHQNEFLHNYYLFESVHDSDHDGVSEFCRPFL